jgi:very-short-patch-repair endonuclease
LVGRRLKMSGWHVLRIWQHELRQPGMVVRRLRRTFAKLK